MARVEDEDPFSCSYSHVESQSQSNNASQSNKKLKFIGLEKISRLISGRWKSVLPFPIEKDADSQSNNGIDEVIALRDFIVALLPSIFANTRF